MSLSFSYGQLEEWAVPLVEIGGGGGEEEMSVIYHCITNPPET